MASRIIRNIVSHVSRMLDPGEVAGEADSSLLNSKIINIRQAGRLALEYYNAGKDRKAENICGLVLKTSPDNIQALNLLGRISLKNAEFKKAAHFFERAIQIDPERDHLYCSLGMAYKGLGRLDDALAAVEYAVDINPKSVTALYNKGLIFKAKGNLGRAAEAFQRVLHTDPDHPSARHLLAALTGETTERAPKRYIVNLFNQYARNFDRHLVQMLEYRLPEVIQIELEMLAVNRRFSCAVDLGCGTGLVGRKIRRVADRLEGVELSPKMARLAKEKKIYDRIFENDMVDFLLQTDRRYDLFVAADVLVYTGNLKPLFASVQASQADNAYFIFTTEKTEKADYHLYQTGRYAHSPAYVRSLAREFGYIVKRSQQTTIRRESGRWVVGNLFVLQL